VKKASLNFPIFEIAAGVYWARKFPNSEAKTSTMPYFTAGSVFFEIVGTFVPGIGLGAPILEVLNKLRPKFQKRIAEKDLDCLKGIDVISSEELLSRLPGYFGYDLKMFISKGKRAVIFLDGYEGLWSESTSTEFTTDKWIRELVASCPGVLFVILGRRKLRWLELDNQGDEWEECIEQYEVIDFDLEHTRELLQKAEITDEDFVKLISKTSHGVPLYIDMCISVYHNELCDKGKVDLEDFPVDETGVFERFIRDLDRYERETLEVLAVPRYFTRDIFNRLIDEFKTSYPESAFKEFLRYSFVREGENADTFVIHDLLRRFLKDEDAKVEEDIERRHRVHQYLFDYYSPLAEFEKPQEYDGDKLTAFYEAVYHGTKLANPFVFVEWFNRAQDGYFDALYRPEWREIIPYLNNVVELLKPSQKSEFSIYTDYLTRLGRLYTNKKLSNTVKESYEKAEDYLKTALEIAEEKLIDELPSLGSIYASWGWLLHSRGNIDSGLHYMEKSLAVRIAGLGERHYKTGMSHNNIGLSYSRQYDLEKAKFHYERSLQIKQTLDDKNMKSIATTMNNLAHTYRKMKDYVEAEKFAHKANGILSEIYGSEHISVIFGINTLALIYSDQKNYAKAESLYLQALMTKETYYDPSDISFAITYNNLSSVYIKQGKYEESIEYLNKAYAIREAIYGIDHIASASTQAMLGFALFKTGNTINGLDFLINAIEIKEKDEYPKFYYVDRDLNWLAEAYRDNGEEEKAKEAEKRAEKYK
ncbi:Tetratricopeptide (TPR) repeat, partial [Candidatus Methanophagaceae archaeon]